MYFLLKLIKIHKIQKSLLIIIYWVIFKKIYVISIPNFISQKNIITLVMKIKL